MAFRILRMAPLLAIGLAACLGVAGGGKLAVAHPGHEDPDESTAAEHAAEGESAGGGHGAGHDDTDLSHANAGPDLENPAEFKSALALWTLLVFLLLLLVLYKFAWGPVSAALERREEAIAGQIAAAQRQHEEAKQMLAQYEAKLASAAEEVREMLEEARRDAEHTKAEIIAEAQKANQADYERLMREVRNAKDAALKEIGESAANAAVLLTERILERQMDASDRNRLVQDALAQFPSQN